MKGSYERRTLECGCSQLKTSDIWICEYISSIGEANNFLVMPVNPGRSRENSIACIICGVKIIQDPILTWCNTSRVMRFSLGAQNLWSLHLFWYLVFECLSSLVGVSCWGTRDHGVHIDFDLWSMNLVVSFYLIQVEMSFWTDPSPIEENSSRYTILYIGHFWRWWTHCIYLCCQISYTAWNRYIYWYFWLH